MTKDNKIHNNTRIASKLNCLLVNSFWIQKSKNTFCYEYTDVIYDTTV